MASAIRPIPHDVRLSVIDHLDELRTRIIISIVAIVVAFGVCFWQNHALLHFINKPLAAQTHKQVLAGKTPLGQAYYTARALRSQIALDAVMVRSLPPSQRPAAEAQLRSMQAFAAHLPKGAQSDLPVTIGVGEPFTATITVTFIFALILALPIVLFELYGFLLPALEPTERRNVVPALYAVPILFASGVAFGYYVVVPAAVRFFQNFNSGEFNILVQASQYYRFAATTMLAMGVVFQVPVVIIGAVRVGIVTTRQLRRGRGLALVLCAALAAFLPGDLITLMLETAPLYLLFELSILVAAALERRARRSEQRAIANAPGA